MGASSFSLFIAFSLLIFSEAIHEDNTVKGVDLDHPVLDLTSHPHPGFTSSQGSRDVLPCERVRVAGLSRFKIESYASSFRVTLAPSVLVPEKLHSKIRICFHQNASRGLCQCEKDEWRPLKKGLWMSFMSPYEERYVDVKFTDDISASITVTVEEDPQRWRLVCLAIGFILLLLAPAVSNWVPFYYSSSMVIGVFLIVIIILFQGMKLLPTGRKTVFYLPMYGSLVGAVSFLLHQFSMPVNGILLNFGISEESHIVAIFVLVLTVLAGAGLGYFFVRKFVISKDGGVDVGMAQFVKWAMRTMATTCILQSSFDTPLALGAVIYCWTTCSLIMKWRRLVRRSSSGDRTSLASQARLAAAKYKRAEFLSRSPNMRTPRKIWTSPKSSYAWSDSPVKGVVSPTYAAKRQSREQEYYSVFHRTPNRRKFTKEEWEEFTRDSTRQAVAELTASPEFTDWVIDHADRIQVLRSDNSDSTIGSESDSTGETAVESDNRFQLFKW